MNDVRYYSDAIIVDVQREDCLKNPFQISMLASGSGFCNRLEELDLLT